MFNATSDADTARLSTTGAFVETGTTVSAHSVGPSSASSSPPTQPSALALIASAEGSTANANPAQTPAGEPSKAGKRKAEGPGPSENLELATRCPICLATMQEPVVWLKCCDAHFCRTCLCKHVSTTKPDVRCPNCRTHFVSMRDAQPATRFVKQTLEVQRESEALLALQHDVQRDRDAALAKRHSSKQTTVALMQKLKNQVFPAIPLNKVPTRKVLPKLTELRETDPNTIVMELSPWTWAAYEERAHGDPNPHPSVVTLHANNLHDVLHRYQILKKTTAQRAKHFVHSFGSCQIMEA